jgi:uncharacterized protein
MIRWRWLCFVISLVLFAVAWPASQRLRFDRSLHRMFAPDDPARIDFEFLQSTFGISDLVVFAYHDNRLWDADGTGLKRLQAIRERIERSPGVATAMDLSKVDRMLSQLEQPLAILGSMSGKEALHPMLSQNSDIAVQFKQIFEGQTHSREGTLVAIACILKSEGKSDESKRMAGRTAIADLRQIANSLPEQGLEPGMLVGQPVMIEEGFDEIERDGVRLSAVSTICLALLVLVGFRSLRWAIISIVVVQWSLVVTRGLLAWLAWDLTMVSSMLASIITVIGVATTMHWMLGYQSFMRTQSSPETALKQSMMGLWRPIVWACVTDAIGFASLSFAKVGPVQDYGCMMAIGSLVVLAGIFLLVPTLALASLAPERVAKQIGLSYELKTIPGDAWLKRCLLRILKRVTASSTAVSLAAIVTCAFAIVGALRLKVETDFIKNFDPSSPLVIAYRAVENELGGAGVWGIILPAPNKKIGQEYLDQVRELERRLRAIEISGPEPLRLSKVLSFADADDASRASPMLGRLTIEGRLIGMQQVMGSFVGSLISRSTSGNRYLHVLLRSREQSEASQKELLIDAVREVVREATGSAEWKAAFEKQTKPPEAIVSGYYVLLTQLVSSVVADQWRCFAVATVGIGIAMAIALRSPWLAFLTILPNALPSFCILGWMGWTGMRVNLGAAMIAAVSMGLSVDSSLHYLIRFQSERKEGKSFDEAIHAAQSEIGMAILLSTLALVLGFGSLASSNFLPTVVFGTTASISMVGGLLGNLVVLPALLRKTYTPSSHRPGTAEDI